MSFRLRPHISAEAFGAFVDDSTRSLTLAEARLKTDVCALDDPLGSLFCIVFVKLFCIFHAER